MIVMVLGLIGYGLNLIFGAILSLGFSGMPHRRHYRLTIAAVVVALMAVQCVFFMATDFETTKEFYPLLIHAPLVIFIIVYCRVHWLRAWAAVFSAYLCCQITRWIAAIALFISNNNVVQYAVYALVILPVLWLLMRYVAGPVSRLTAVSVRSTMLFGAVPFFYYIFDYATTVYTDLLYQGVKAATQFMPSVVSIFYFVFVLIYYTEQQKRTSAEQQAMLLSSQANQASRELASYKSLAEQASVYRHDMRHHLALIEGLLDTGSPEKARQYIHETQAAIDSITPVRYCGNATVNLILSSFAAKAKSLGVDMSVSADLPAELDFPEIELCTLLSNMLENAVTAASAAAVPESASASATGNELGFVRLTCRIHKGNLLLRTENSFSGTVQMENGLPLSPCGEGHGFGVRSIAMITNKYKGYYSFTPKENIFIVKIVLPL